MRRRPEMDAIHELARLHRLHVTTRKAARALGISRATHLEYKRPLVEAGLLEGVPDELPAIDHLGALIPQRRHPKQVSTAAGPEDRIRELVREGYEAMAIKQRLQTANRDLDVSYDAVKRLCRRLPPAEPASPANVAIRVETSTARFRAAGRIAASFATVRCDAALKSGGCAWASVA